MSESSSSIVEQTQVIGEQDIERRSREVRAPVVHSDADRHALFLTFVQFASKGSPGTAMPPLTELTNGWGEGFRESGHPDRADTYPQLLLTAYAATLASDAATVWQQHQPPVESSATKPDTPTEAKPKRATRRTRTSTKPPK